jgi:hypothetical protein
MSGESGDKGFTIVDRRASAGAEGAQAESEPHAPPEAGARAAGGPTVDFPMLVQSFFVTALYHLGMAADPDTGQPGECNLPAARQNIEILEVLAIKTRGNLETDERQLLESVLYELRMRFVEASRTPAA